MEIKPEKQFNPWVFLWFRPKATLHTLIEGERHHSIWWLIPISGLLSGILGIIASWGTLADKGVLAHIGLIVSNPLLGILGSYVYYWAMPYLLKWVGGWIGGTGTIRELRYAVGWYFYLCCVVSALGIIAFLLNPSPQAQGIFGILYIIASLWAFVVFFLLIGEAHHMSGWRAVGTVAVLLAIVLAITLVVGVTIQFINLFRGSGG